MSTTTSLEAERLVYTVEEVARLLGLARRSVYQMVREGKIPARQMGARWVISKARFHAWLNAETAAPADGQGDPRPAAELALSGRR